MNASAIENVPLFGVLKEPQRTLLGERMVLERFPAGALLFSQGEPADKLFLIKSGWVRLSSEQMAVLANLSQGSLLADADVLLGHNHSTSAEAVSEVEVWSLGLADLVDVVSEDPEIGLKLSQIYRGSVVPLIRYLVERRLRPIPGLDELPDTALATVAGRLCVRNAQAGELLFTAGQAPTSLYIVDEGDVQIGSPDAPAAEYGPGDVVAERNLLLGRSHTITARAATPSRLWELSAGDLERLSGLYPDLRAALSRVLKSHLDAPDIARAVGLLRATPIFQSLSDNALQDLAGKLVWQVAQNGNRICEAAAPAEAMYVVEGGSVELLSPYGESQGSVQAGAYFGEMGLYGGTPYGFAAVARNNTTLWVLSRADFAEVAARHPEVQRALNEQVQREREEAAEHFAERHMRRLTLFANTTPEQLRAIAGYLRPEHFAGGQVIYQRGQPGDALYLIEQGRVSVQTRGADGRRRVLAVMGPGDFVGETALLTGEPHGTDTFAQNEVSAWALTRADFETLLAEYPVLALNLSRVLSYRLRQSNEQMAAGAAAATEAAAPGSEAQPAAAAGVAPVTDISRSPSSGGNAAEVDLPRSGAKGAPARRPVARPVAAGSVADIPRRAAEGAPAAGSARPALLAAPIAWFTALSTGTKIRLLLIALLVIWLLGVAAPSLIISLVNNGPARPAQSAKTSLLESSMLVAMADSNGLVAVAAQATWTPWPTETPIPSPTPTATLVPTATPVPPTATPAPTATAVPPTATSVPPTPVPQPVVAQAAAPAAPAAAAVQVAAAPAAPPKPAKKYELIKFYHLTGCENGWNHVAKVHVVDAAGNPVDGVLLMFRAAGWGDIFDVQPSGRKGPGWIEFDLHKDGQYMFYPTVDKVNPDNSDVTPPVGTVRDPDGNIWPPDPCNGNNGNTMGHNSFEIVFRKNF